jgi:Domain of unknown function (DUF397)
VELEKERQAEIMNKLDDNGWPLGLRLGPWRKSSYSKHNGNECVEVASTSEGAVLRDSKHVTAGTITFTHAQWARFLTEARADSPSDNGAVTVTHTPDGGTTIRSLHNSLELMYDADEWAAFTHGACDGEFDFRGSQPGRAWLAPRDVGPPA